MTQKGFLLVLMQPPLTIEEEFNAWYDTEHVPERLAVPGVDTAIRFASIDSTTPKYLAMYDLASESVLDTEAYVRVSGGNSSPWTKRVTGRTNVYRSIGRQIYPGNAITMRTSRVTIVRFRNLDASQADAVIASMREAFESRPSTVQTRVFAYHVGGKVDFLGMVSLSVPDETRPDPRLFSALGAAIDLFATYAPLPV